MVNPCCCMSLQRGTIILAIIDGVLMGILMVLYTLAFISLIVLKPSDYEKYDINESERAAAIVLCVIIILIAICQIVLAAYLRQGAMQNDPHRCRKWLIISSVLFVLSLIGLIVNLATSSYGAYYLVTGILGLVYKIYEMFVVFSFIKELNNGGGLFNSYYSGA